MDKDIDNIITTANSLGYTGGDAKLRSAIKLVVKQSQLDLLGRLEEQNEEGGIPFTALVRERERIEKGE